MKIGVCAVMKIGVCAVLLALVILVSSVPVEAQEVMSLNEQIAIQLYQAQIAYAVLVSYQNAAATYAANSSSMLVPRIDFDWASFSLCAATTCAGSAFASFFTGPQTAFAGCTGAYFVCAVRSTTIRWGLAGENKVPTINGKEFELACSESYGNLGLVSSERIRPAFYRSGLESR